LPLLFRYFENDKFPITCEKGEDGKTWCTVLLCLCYCYGCLCPITVSCPLDPKGDGGGDVI